MCVAEEDFSIIQAKGKDDKNAKYFGNSECWKKRSSCDPQPFLFALELATEPYPQLCVETLIVANNDAYGPF